MCICREDYLRTHIDGWWHRIVIVSSFTFEILPGALSCDKLTGEKFKLNTMVELMAPAGGFEAMTAAINAGADAVYFGIEQLNMRARATMNFTLGDIPEIVRRCENAGVKSYITLNTVIYDHDIRLMREIVRTAKDAGISAIIAADQSVIMYASSIGMPVHISTQSNVSNIEAVKFYSHFADVVVLARELTLQQVKSIAEEIKREGITGPSGKLIRLEIFAHGALCMAISGKCYLSLHSHNASGNRGACIQNCRRSYTVIDKEEGFELDIENEYIMSPKDLCTIDFLDKVLDAGISVLKLEGRGRSADYVDNVTRCYREAIDSIKAGTYGYEMVNDWKERLSNTYNRGFWDGYYLGRKLGEWSDVYGSKAKQKKIFIGRGRHYFSQINVAEFSVLSHSLKPGDKVLVTGPTTGVMYVDIAELRVDERPVKEATKGQFCSFKVSGKIRPSDKLYKIVEA